MAMPNNRTNRPAELEGYRERQALVLDYVKHVTTLATGSIVLLIAILEKLFSKPEARGLVVIALALLVVAIITLTLSALGILRSIRDATRGGKANTLFTVASFLVGLGSFLAGIVALAAFSIVNLVE